MKRICLSDAGRQIRQQLTMREVAELYGFTPDRNGFIKCPFHSDNHGSLKLYPEDRGWHCFGCNAGGSVIDFVMKLFDLTFQQAVLRLDSDFGKSTARRGVSGAGGGIPAVLGHGEILPAGAA